MSKTTSFRMDDDLGDKVDALAKTLDRPKGWVIEQALRRYVETEGWQIEAIQGALDDLRSGHAELVPHDDVMARMDAKLKARGLLAVNLVWLRQAERDLDDAIDYIAASNPATALQLYQTIREKVGLLPGNPGIGRPGRVDGTRELVIYPYIVAYTVQADIDAVVILRVLHGARQWPEEIEVEN